MTSLIQVFTFSFILTIFTQLTTHVNAYTRIGNLIRDLESNDSVTFGNEANPWKVSPSTIVTKTSQCEGTFLMGGFNVLKEDGSFKRTYYDLPPHNIIYYSIYASFIDQWYYNASFIVHFDNYHAAVGVFLFNEAVDFDRDYCGDSGTKDLQGLIMSGKIYHDAEDLTLSVWTINHYAADIRAFGFRDIVLHFRNKTKFEYEQNCGNAPDLPHDIPLGQCICEEGEYLPTTGSVKADCLACNSLCETCLGPATNQCLKCKPTGAFFDGTDCKACHPSCLTCSGDGEDQCITCPSGFFLFDGNRCVDTCNFPLTSTTVPVLTCTFPCGTNQFVTPTGNCQDTCDYRYNSVLWHGRKFCNDYCTGGLFFVPPTDTVGGSCLVACPAGTTQDAVAPYCHRCVDTLCSKCPINNGAVCTECLSGAVLDSDGVCKKCDSFTMTYLNPRSTGHQYHLELFPTSCNLNAAAVQTHLDLTAASRTSLPSASFEVFYSSPNEYIVNMNFQESVLQDMQLYVTIETLNGPISVPKKLVPSEGLLPLEDVAPVAGTIITGAIGSSFAAAIALGSTAAIWSIVSFQQFVGYFKYMNIDYPFQLQVFFDMLSADFFAFLPNPLETVTESLKEDMLGDGADEDYTPPQKFAMDEMSSFFIDNGGSIISTNLALHLLLAALIVLKRYRRSEHRWLTWIRENLRWNILARAFLENGIPLWLAVCLQLRRLSMSNAYIGISSVATFIALIYCLIMLGFLVKYLYNTSIKDLKEEKNKEILGTLTEGIELKEFGSKFYHIIIFLRGIVLVFLIVFFEDIPFFQIIPCILMNAGLIYYLFQEANFEDKGLGIINKIKESLIILGEMFILALNFKNASETHYSTMGWLALACFCSSLLIETVYMISIQVRNYKELKAKIIALWNAIKTWFKNLEARRRNEGRRSRRRYDRAIQNESAVVDVSAEIGVPPHNQFD